MSASTVKKNRQIAREQGVVDKKVQAELELAAKKKKEKTKWTIGAIVVAVVLVLVLFINSGAFKNNSTAATIGDEKYEPGVVSYLA